MPSTMMRTSPICACPLRCRTEDRALMMLTELALVLLYICVLVIKTCDISTDACALFGFGGSPK
eukprot:3087129-Prymnesium_polylepis.2